MAIDTRSKRFSMMNFGEGSAVSLPVADGTIDAGDRSHLLGMYSGIAKDAPVAITFVEGITDEWIIPDDDDWRIRDDPDWIIEDDPDWDRPA